ncbi:MAG: hypothetical protein JWN41_1606, partial [Thermoleophilia bacterium]|nr:hypothetical protein [Thermoleophilia bacterium]
MFASRPPFLIVATLLVSVIFTTPASAQWSAPISQTTAVAPNQPPIVALDAAGNATTLVRRSRPEGGNQLVAVDTPAGATTATAAIPLTTLDDPAMPIVLVDQYRLAVSRTGVAVAVWTMSSDYNGNGYIEPGDEVVAYESHRPVGGAWTAPMQLSAAGRMVSLGEIDLAMNDSGAAVAVWPLTRTSTGAPTYTVTAFAGLEYATFEAGAWARGGSVANPNDYNMNAPQVAVDNFGHLGIAWVHAEPVNGTRAEIRVSTGELGSDLGIGSSASDPDGSIAGYAHLRDIAMNGAGDLAVAWVDGSGVGMSVGTLAADGGGAMEVEPFDGGSPEVANLIVMSGGACIVTYVALDAQMSLMASTHEPSGTWTEPQSLASLQAAATRFVAGVDSTDVVTVVYQQSDGMYVRQMSADGWQPDELVATGVMWDPESISVNGVGDR